jgi:hypothetical protein
MAHEWQVGELYLGFNRNGLPVWKQPGGIGTPVFPELPTLFPAQFQGYQQAVMSYPSLYVLGCTHPSNCLEVYQVFQPSLGTQVALIVCGQCSFIQQILLLTEYQNYMDVPIVVA